jgi:hypothetical protein
MRKIGVLPPMSPYTQDELNSLWQRLTEKGSNDDPEYTYTLINLPAAITKNTDTEQEMIFDTSEGEVAAYTDFDVLSDPIPTVICSRIRETPNEAWGNWTACRIG